MKPKPTKAEVEFEGDCYSLLYDADAKECKMCGVSVQCAAAMIDQVKSEVDRPTAPLAPLTQGTTQALEKPSQQYEVFWEGTASRAAHDALQGLPPGFTLQDALAAFITRAKSEAVDYGNPERNLRHVICVLKARGLIRREGERYFLS